MIDSKFLMANPDHVEHIVSGVRHWNRWRRTHPWIKPDLSEKRFIKADLAKINLSGVSLRAARLAQANLSSANLVGADLAGAYLAGANLQGAKLIGANLGGAELFQGDLSSTNLQGTNLTHVDLSQVLLRRANLSEARIRTGRGVVLIEATMSRCDLNDALLAGADLTSSDMAEAKLRRANLTGALLVEANLEGADLREATLIGANLSRANLGGAKLRGANLAATILNETNLSGADLTGCHVYGMSAWNLKLKETKQNDLSITPEGEPVIVVDNLEVAQFIYLVLNNDRLKNVIDTITSKAVLILGRFTPERKKVLDRIRTHLRSRDVLPIMFDFKKPRARSILETVSTLAHMSKVVLVDLTDARYVKQEIPRILRELHVTIYPFITEDQSEPDVITRLRPRRFLQPTIRYKSTAGLLSEIDRLLETHTRKK